MNDTWNLTDIECCCPCNIARLLGPSGCLQTIYFGRPGLFSHRLVLVLVRRPRRMYCWRQWIWLCRRLGVISMFSMRLSFGVRYRGANEVTGYPSTSCGGLRVTSGRNHWLGSQGENEGRMGVVWNDLARQSAYTYLMFNKDNRHKGDMNKLGLNEKFFTLYPMVLL